MEVGFKRPTPTASPTNRRRTRSRRRARCLFRDGRALGPARPGGARRSPCRRWSLTMKLACFSLTTAPPTRVPFRPSRSMMPPAESSVGLRNTLPADGMPSGWWAWRQLRISSSRRPTSSGSSGVRSKLAHVTTSGVLVGCVLEDALAVGQAQAVGVERLLGAVRAQNARLGEHGTDVRFMGAGVGPHRAADGARDGQAELEPGQALRPRQTWPRGPSAARSRRSVASPRSAPAARGCG